MRALSTVGNNGAECQQLFFATSDAPVLMGPRRVDSLFSATSADLTKRTERQVSLNDVVNASRALEATKQRKRKGAATSD